LGGSISGYICFTRFALTCCFDHVTCQLIVLINIGKWAIWWRILFVLKVNLENMSCVKTVSSFSFYLIILLSLHQVSVATDGCVQDFLGVMVGALTVCTQSLAAWIT